MAAGAYRQAGAGMHCRVVVGTAAAAHSMVRCGVFSFLLGSKGGAGAVGLSQQAGGTLSQGSVALYLIFVVLYLICMIICG